MKTFAIAVAATLLLVGASQATYPHAVRVVQPVQKVRIEYVVRLPQLVRQAYTVERIEYQAAPQTLERHEQIVERVQGGYQSSRILLIQQQKQQQRYAPQQQQQFRGYNAPLEVVRPPQRIVEQTETKRGLLGRIRQQRTTVVIE